MPKVNKQRNIFFLYIGVLWKTCSRLTQLTILDYTIQSLIMMLNITSTDIIYSLGLYKKIFKDFSFQFSEEGKQKPIAFHLTSNGY